MTCNDSEVIRQSIKCSQINGICTVGEEIYKDNRGGMVETNYGKGAKSNNLYWRSNGEDHDGDDTDNRT